MTLMIEAALGLASAAVIIIFIELRPLTLWMNKNHPGWKAEAWNYIRDDKS